MLRLPATPQALRPAGSSRQLRAVSHVPQNLGLRRARRSGWLVCQAAADSSKEQKKNVLATDVSTLDQDIGRIAVPVMAALAAEPIAALLDTAYVGRLGATELAAVGVGLSMYTTVARLFNMPLLAVTTSTVAAAAGQAANASSSQEKDEIMCKAVSSAVLIAGIAGLLQAFLVALCAATSSKAWGAGPGSAIHVPTMAFLTIRLLGAPVNVMLLTLQGVFRGLQDTKTPLYGTLANNALNVVLGPLFIFGLKQGVRGAAMGTVLAQLLSCSWLLRQLTKRHSLRLSDPSTLKHVLTMTGPTGFLMMRTFAITSTYAIATATAAHAGALAAATHQVCFQVWLAASLVNDSLGAAAQTLLAKGLAAKDHVYAKAVAIRTTQLAGLMGVLMAVGLGLFSTKIPALFTKDPNVLAAMGTLMPFVVATQPINALAFVWDGILYGASGFPYAALATGSAALPSIAVIKSGLPRLLLGAQAAATASPATTMALYSAWSGLTVLMILRFTWIYLPFHLRKGPFAMLAEQKAEAAAAPAPGASGQEQQAAAPEAAASKNGVDGAVPPPSPEAAVPVPGSNGAAPAAALAADQAAGSQESKEVTVKQ